MPPDIIPATPASTTPAVSGGPEASAVPAVVKPAPAVVATPIYSGIGGEMKTVEELTAYTKNIETQLLTARAQATPHAPATTAPATPKDEDAEFYQGIQEELFQDPASAIRKLEDRIDRRRDQKDQRAKSNDQFWDNFYSENQDLVPLKSVVKSIVAERNAEISPLKLSDAKTFIATEARKIVAAVREQAGITEQILPSGGATVLGSSAPAQGGKTASPAVPVNFIDQVRTLQGARRRK